MVGGVEEENGPCDIRDSRQVVRGAKEEDHGRHDHQGRGEEIGDVRHDQDLRSSGPARARARISASAAEVREGGRGG